MMLLGAILAKGRPSWAILNDGRYESGYYPRFKITISHPSIDLLEALQRELKQQAIHSRISKPRVSYELTIRKLKDQIELVDYMKRKSPIWFKVGKWATFVEALEIVKNKEHLTQDGMDKLMILKGLIE